MKRILFISQIADPSDPRLAFAPREAETMPPVLAALGAALVFHDAIAAAPPDPAGFDGVIVGGSFGSANDREPWRLALRGWLARHQHVPLVGICGGHQLLARALGTPIERCETPQMGIFPLDLPGIPGFLGEVIQLHGERVAGVPPGAELWAHDAVGIQALRYGPTRWTFQFHPEMSEDVARAAGAISGVEPATWNTVGPAVRGGRAILAAWLAAL